MKVLQIIESAYRATSEEQDDTVVWITHAMKSAGADLTVVLCGGAVNYAIPDQDASGLSFGAWRQTQPARLAEDIAALIAKGVRVYRVREDVLERGLVSVPAIAGVEDIDARRLPSLMREHDSVWRW
jgi:hypothetical protein